MSYMSRGRGSVYTTLLNIFFQRCALRLVHLNSSSPVVLLVLILLCPGTASCRTTWNASVVSSLPAANPNATACEVNSMHRSEAYARDLNYDNSFLLHLINVYQLAYFFGRAATYVILLYVTFTIFPRANQVQDIAQDVGGNDGDNNDGKDENRFGDDDSDGTEYQSSWEPSCPTAVSQVSFSCIRPTSLKSPASVYIDQEPDDFNSSLPTQAGKAATITVVSKVYKAQPTSLHVCGPMGILIPHHEKGAHTKEKGSSKSSNKEDKACHSFNCEQNETIECRIADDPSKEVSVLQQCANSAFVALLPHDPTKSMEWLPLSRVTEECDAGTDVHVDIGGLFGFCSNADMQYNSIVKEPLQFSLSHPFGLQQNQNIAQQEIHSSDCEPCCFDFYLRPFQDQYGD